MNKVFFILFITICSNSIYGQRLSLSAELGQNYGSNFEALNSPIFFSHLGIMGNYELRTNLNVHSGLFYDQKYFTNMMPNGYFEKNGITGYNYDMRYLTVPVELKYQIKVAKGLQLFANGGIFAGYALNGRYTLVGPLIDGTPQKMTFNDLESLRRLDAGVQAGGGIAFNFGLYIKANISRGVLNLSKIENVNYNSKALQLTLGFAPKIKFKRNRSTYTP